MIVELPKIVLQPIDEIDLSGAFKSMAAAHDSRTLLDILNWPAAVLLMHEGFAYHHYHELRAFLQENELIHLMRMKK